MNWKGWNRTIHRWLSIIFVITVLMATAAAATGQDQSSILYYLPLLPLFILMATGLIMFVLHYAANGRPGAAAGNQQV